MEPGIEIGLIKGAFGIKGEVTILSHYDEPERFKSMKILSPVFKDSSTRDFRIEKVRIHKGVALVKLEGVDDRTAADELKGSTIHVAEIDLTENEQAVVELEKVIGLEVYTVDGERLGVLEEVIRTGANDVFEVRDGGKSILLPVIDEVILDVDFESGRMTVDPLPGLL